MALPPLPGDAALAPRPPRPAAQAPRLTPRPRRAGRMSAMADASRALRASLAEQLASLRGTTVGALPAPLLDVVVTRVPLAGEDAFVVHPADWDALRDEEGAAARPIPYWARLWPSGLALAEALAAAPPQPGTRVLELGCGLGLPSIVAARAGADVLATDAASDAV